MTLLGKAQNLEIFHKKEGGGRVDKPATDGCRFGPLVYPQWTVEARIKNLPNWVNCQMVCFIFVFEQYIQKFQILDL